MANIGDVTARLRADVGPYITGMQEAGAATRQFTQSGTESASRTEQLGLAFQRLERREPTMALRQVRGAVSLLSLEAIGATGPVGRLAESIGFLAAGSAVGLGVAAGVAALVGAYRLLTSEARNATKAHEELNAALLKIEETAPNVAAAVALNEATARLETAQNKLSDAQARHEKVMRGELVAYTDEDKTLRTLQQNVLLAQQAVDRLGAAFRKAHGEAADTFIDPKKIREMAMEIDGLNRTVTEAGAKMFSFIAGIRIPPIDVTGIDTLAKHSGAAGDKLAHVNDELRRLAEEITRAAQTPQQKFQQQMEDIAAVGGFISPETADRASKMAGKELQRSLDPAVKEVDDRMGKQMERAGYHAMRSLIDGILRGKADFQDIFISILSEFLSAGLGSLFGGLFHFAGAAGGGAAAKDFAGAMKFSINVPAASNPIVAARDAQWQAAWRETARVAYQSGFKLG